MQGICKKNGFLSLENEKNLCKTCEEYIKIRENSLSFSVNDHINNKHGKSKNIPEPKQMSLHKAF